MTSEELVALDEQIAAAKQRLAKRDQVVEEVESQLRDAKDAQWAAHKELRSLNYLRDAPKREAALAAKLRLLGERNGPMRPVGVRVVRTSCVDAEVHAILQRDSIDVGCNGVFATKGADGRTWFTTGYFAVRSTVDKLTMTERNIDCVIRDRVALLARENVPVKSEHGTVMWCRNVGGVHIQLTYATMIEDLFPELEWWSTGSNIDPVNAYVNDELVAIVMPVRMP